MVIIGHENFRGQDLQVLSRSLQANLTLTSQGVRKQLILLVSWRNSLIPRHILYIGMQMKRDWPSVLGRVPLASYL